MSIAKHLFAEEAVLVNFTLVEEDQARRIVDFLTGTVYALTEIFSALAMKSSYAHQRIWKLIVRQHNL